MKILLIAAAVIVLLVILEIYREVHTFRVTHYSVETDRLDRAMKEKRVVVLSDLHNCVYGEKNEKLLNAVRKEHPDIILVAGDMLIGSADCSAEAAEAFMTEVQKTAQVYYANGNHEQRMKECEERYGDIYRNYKEKLLKAGIIFLENDSRILEWDKEKVRITGLEIPLAYYKKFTGERVTLEEIETRIGKSGSCYEILLAHNPVHAESYRAWGADLVLSGHIHGGIIRIPFSRGVITPQAILFPKYSGGQYRVGKMELVVSKGLGNHSVNIRLFNEAEVVVLHIKGTK